MSREETLYGLLAEFDTPEALIAADHRVRDAGYRDFETYTPFPVEELSNPHQRGGTWIPVLVFVGGCLGAAGAFFMQYYSAVYHYPLNVGGRPLNSWPSFMPVTFEMTVLLGALFGLVGMIVLNGLPRPHHPLFGVPQFDRASRDRFFLAIESTDPEFDKSGTREFLLSLGPREVVEVPP
jgi:hypothetical protein